MKTKLMPAHVAMCSLLAACGGGSGGGGTASTPPPPSAQANSTLTDLRYSDTFAAQTSGTEYRLSRSTGGTTPISQGPSSTPNATVRYDVTSQTYTVTGVGGTVSFGPSSRIADQSTNVITMYEKKAGSKQENLALFKPGAGNTELALTYTSYGAYQRITDNGDLDVRTSFFAFGVRTDASQMPRSGMATYTTQIDGQFADSSGAYVLGGDSSFMADFTAATFAFAMTPLGKNILSGRLKYFDSHLINGRIGGDLTGVTVGQAFSGRGPASRDGYSASVDGYFFGPGAAEIGGTFMLVGNNGVGVGAVVGRKN